MTFTLLMLSSIYHRHKTHTITIAAGCTGPKRRVVLSGDYSQVKDSIKETVQASCALIYDWEKGRLYRQQLRLASKKYISECDILFQSSVFSPVLILYSNFKVKNIATDDFFVRLSSCLFVRFFLASAQE